MYIPEEYVIQKFYQYANKPKYNRHTRTYQGGCPICREGKSWGTKRRLFYVTKRNLIFCHNCGWSGNPLKWVAEVTGETYGTILKELENYDNIKIETAIESKPIETPDLPEDSIDITDKTQLEFYKDNEIVKAARNYIISRRLDVAANRPKGLYTTLKDKIHKNRLVLPFYDNGKAVHYQSRSILDYDLKFKPKYLSKRNGDKSLFNIDNIKNDLDYIFVFEGPIDSFFTLNGVAVAGIQEDSYAMFTNVQQLQLKRFPLHKIVWVLDSQWQDEAALKKSIKLVENEQRLFIWPENIGTQFKDFNEMCCKFSLNSIKPEFIIKNSYSGLKAKLLITQIKN